ncbi:RNA polymerase sigma factor [Algibacter lectus]|uniref:RNA polymerase sigma factor n=1 Tax=Algibacter lectus TaxID=221126 RepID=UPI00249403AE|nr:sigma-70 family RNA polymerase sigma factor [Algibacter lectus]
MKTIKLLEVEKDKFISVIKDNQNLIYKICYSYCSNSENRKDLQQEILLQLWNSFSKFDGRVKISTWIYRIALNTAITFYRNDCKHKDKKVTIDASIISLSYFESDSGKDENIVMLYHLIERLDEMDKALILLYLDDNKYKEIADILGISETNVATKISRIKKSLKEQFSNN